MTSAFDSTSERETGIEPAYPAWKAGALATVLLSRYLNLIKRLFIVKDFAAISYFYHLF